MLTLLVILIACFIFGLALMLFIVASEIVTSPILRPDLVDCLFAAMAVVISAIFTIMGILFFKAAL